MYPKYTPNWIISSTTTTTTAATTRASLLFLLLLLLFITQHVVIIIPNVEGAKFICSKDELIKYDTTVTRIASFKPIQRPYPENSTVLPKYCRQFRGDMNIINEQVNKCFTEDSRQFASILAYSVRTVMRNYCATKHKGRLENFFSMCKCINRNTKILGDNMNKFLDGVIRGKRAEPRKTRIGYACCGYYKFIRDIKVQLKPVCTEKTIAQLEHYFHSIFQNLIDVACGDYVEHSDKCDKLKEPPKRTKEDDELGYESFMLPTIELWNSL